MLTVAPLAFFVYATQQPQLKAIMLTLDSRAAGLPQVVSYLIAPLLTIAFSLAAALVLRRAAPQAFTLASGGRAARDSPTTLAPELAKSGP